MTLTAAVILSALCSANRICVLSLRLCLRGSGESQLSHLLCSLATVSVHVLVCLCACEIVACYCFSGLYV